MKPMTAFKAIAILHFACFILHSHGAVIEQVIVRQQWPWSTDVKVEYKVTPNNRNRRTTLTVTHGCRLRRRNLMPRQRIQTSVTRLALQAEAEPTSRWR